MALQLRNIFWSYVQTNLYLSHDDSELMKLLMKVLWKGFIFAVLDWEYDSDWIKVVLQLQVAVLSIGDVYNRQ